MRKYYYYVSSKFKIEIVQNSALTILPSFSVWGKIVIPKLKDYLLIVYYFLII